MLKPSVALCAYGTSKSFATEVGHRSQSRGGKLCRRPAKDGVDVRIVPQPLADR